MTMIPIGSIPPIKRRVIAYVIDALIVGAVSIVGFIIALVLTLAVGTTGDPNVALLRAGIVLILVFVLMLAWFVVYTIMQTRGGSIGMRTQKLRLASAVDGAPLTFWRALLRNVVFGVTSWFVIGAFSPLFDGSGRFQGWHDRAAGALMLEAGHAVPPRPQPAPPSQTAPPAPVPPTMPVPPTVPVPPTMPLFPPHGEEPVMPAVPPTMPAPPAVQAAPVPPAPAPAPASAARVTDSEFPDETVLSPREAAAKNSDPLISFVPGVTQPGAPERVVAPPVPPLPAAAAAASAPSAQDAPLPTPHAPASAPHAPAPTPDDDDDDLESTRISIPGHRLVITWDDGQRVSISGRTVFGRNPEPEPDATVVAVRDETLSLSKTHFEASADVSGGWIIDRQSTNGTIIVRDGIRIECVAGQRTPIRLGDAIEIGDRIATIGGYA